MVELPASLVAEGKACSYRKLTKPTTEFGLDKTQLDGRNRACKSCLSNYRAKKRLSPEWVEAHKSAQRRYRARYPERKRIAGINARFQIDFESMWRRQGGICAICNTRMEPRGLSPTSVVVDHDHGCCANESSCGKCVRGLVHKRCNVVLGFSGDSTEVLAGAINYLKRWGERHHGKN